MKVFRGAIMVCALMGFGVMIGGVNYVYASGEGGGSEDGEVHKVTCQTAEHTRNIEECSDAYGGASWHVFKVSNPPKIAGVSSGDGVSTANKFPIYATGLDVITAKGMSDVSNFSSICPSSQYDYYLAYVYDGWNGANLTGGAHYYGPAQWGDPSDCPTGKDGPHCPVYHTRGTHYSANQIINGAKNGSAINTWRVTGTRPESGRSKGNYDTVFQSSEAKKLYDNYRELAGKTARSFTNVGFFCMPTSYKSFEGRAYASSTADTGYVASSKTANDSINCKNDGCTANFKLYLKRLGGPGKTIFGFGENSGVTALKSSPLQPSTEGTKVGESLNVGLKPGQKKCRHITFHPHGGKKISNTATATACITAKITNFEGKSSVSGGAEGTTGWKKSNKTVTTSIKNCSPTSGCKVTFKHWMRRSGSIGSSAYTVTRTSNFTNKVKTMTKDGIFDTGEKEVSSSSDLVLYPGMTVCEKLTFKPSNDSTKTVDDVYTKVCVLALGNAQDGSLLDIKVRNTSVSKWNSFQQEVYAKPGTAGGGKADVVEFRTTYNPTLQYTYNLKPEQMKIDGGAIKEGDGSKLGDLFNKYKSPHWNNAMSVSSKCFSGGEYDKDFTNYTIGSQEKHTETNQHTIKGSEVGESYPRETAETNRNAKTSTTVSQVSFSSNSNKNLANVITDAVSGTASVKVPYNFKNTTKVNDNQPKFFAGETAEIGFTIEIAPKQNNETGGKYATIVRDAKWYLQVCIDGNSNCTNTATESGNLNGGYNLNGIIERKYININIPDKPAGTQICITSFVRPSASGDDKNWSDRDGSHRWASSADTGVQGTSKCFKVVKRPSLQVWGGNVYTGGKIKTGISTKGHLADYEKYGVQTNYSKRIFGSWGELGVITNASVTGFHSGASVGYLENNNGTLWPNYRFTGADGTTKSYLGGGNIAGKKPGGSSETDFCKRVPLTIANSPCGNNTTGLIGTSIAMNQAASDKTNVLNKLLKSEDESNNVEYTYRVGNLPVGTTNVSETDGKIKVFYATGDVEVKGDIVYAGSYSNFEQLPKVVLYANGDIVIDCNVNRIDALLIADNTVKTCNSDNFNARANSNQLLINGAIVAKKLDANRTYGAATGANSIIPAEIIDFDPTLYLWGNIKSETNNKSKKLDVTYTHELAPRR